MPSGARLLALALTLVPAMAPGTSVRGTDKTRHGPQLIASGPLQAPTKKNKKKKEIQPALAAVLFHRLHRRIALANGKVVIFTINLHQAPQNFGKVPSLPKHQNFLHPQLIIPRRGCWTGCSSSTFQRSHSGVVHQLRLAMGPQRDPYEFPTTRRSCAYQLGRLTSG